MTSSTRNTFLIMLGIIAAEGYPMWLALGHAAPERLLRLYTASLVDFWPAWAAAAALVVAYVLNAIRGLPLIGQRFFELHPLKLLAIPFAVISGTMEELWVRRAGMDWAQGLGANVAVQIAGSAILFGLAHGVWGLFARRWQVAVNSVIATTFLGGVLAAIYVLGGRNIAPCIWAHFAINLAIEPWLLMAAMQARPVRGAVATAIAPVAQPL
jgi:hypothetical protein